MYVYTCIYGRDKKVIKIIVPTSEWDCCPHRVILQDKNRGMTLLAPEQRF